MLKTYISKMFKLILRKIKHIQRRFDSDSDTAIQNGNLKMSLQTMQKDVRKTDAMCFTAAACFTCERKQILSVILNIWPISKAAIAESKASVIGLCQGGNNFMLLAAFSAQAELRIRKKHS